MRINTPVTKTEHRLQDGEFIVSKTDLDGRIVYANETFIAISGYTPDELIGADHNILRHPDMPPEAFRDMWQALKAGKPWQGLVKNRCKNGDFYWVVANANPIWDDGTISGYMSLRVQATSEQAAAAEAFYRKLRSGAKGWTVRDGRAARTGFLGAAERAVAGLREQELEGWLAVLGVVVATNFVAALSIGARQGAVTASAALSCLALILLLVFVVKLRSTLFAPLRRAERALMAVGAGNLTQRMEAYRVSPEQCVRQTTGGV